MVKLITVNIILIMKGLLVKALTSPYATMVKALLKLITVLVFCIYFISVF